MMDELKVQLPSKPSTIILSVGGGGLLLGVLKGLERLGKLYEVFSLSVPFLPICHELEYMSSLK
jgi:threonine dehydratase